MPTPSDRGVPPDGPPIEPIRVLRPRRTDALAELMKDLPPRAAVGYESFALPGPQTATEDATEELPPVRDDHDRARRSRDLPRGRMPGLPRAAVAAAVTAAAVIGFGCALLLADRGESTAAAAPRPSATVSEAPTPTPTASGATDPDGPGTLRQGDSGPEVSDLQERLRHIPNVYDNGSTDGTYDTTLTEAVARFQLWYGIRGDEDGVYGDDTRRDLESRTGG
ncbi:peptidoglycan-binding domain-containing protein [Streptomyces pseudovenezuelae]|uniref:peptidoglycan-binding domain-containing protein n=1 Tax=Streptomyces pseudovenezuelae TaxID=67350 RepID=UPI002E8002A6|nr:peptidoglycan-binding domain-containing protein [Streptomyces pseudovenezuelae]WUA86532.1 peptidoglycan-binding protein [Streptomyces pseudovenezuelae]